MMKYCLSGLVVAAVLVAGCGVSVEPPPRSSVTEVKNITLNTLGEIEKAQSEGKTGGRRGGASLRELAECLQYLQGTLELTGVGAEKDQQALAEAYYRIARIAGDPGAQVPEHLQDGGTPFIQGDDLKAMLPQIRKIVEAVPNSNKCPPPKRSSKHEE